MKPLFDRGFSPLCRADIRATVSSIVGSSLRPAVSPIASSTVSSILRSVFTPLLKLSTGAVVLCMTVLPISVMAQGQTPSAIAVAVPSPMVIDSVPHGGDDPLQASELGSDDLGRGTMDLLSLQVSGRAAARGEPIPGDQATASYKRYIDSFSKPIPDFFSNTIKSSSGS